MKEQTMYNYLLQAMADEHKGTNLNVRELAVKKFLMSNSRIAKMEGKEAKDLAKFIANNGKINNGLLDIDPVLLAGKPQYAEIIDTKGGLGSTSQKDPSPAEVELRKELRNKFPKTQVREFAIDAIVKELCSYSAINRLNDEQAKKFAIEAVKACSKIDQDTINLDKKVADKLIRKVSQATLSKQIAKSIIKNPSKLFQTKNSVMKAVNKAMIKDRNLEKSDKKQPKSDVSDYLYAMLKGKNNSLIMVKVQALVNSLGNNTISSLTGKQAEQCAQEIAKHAKIMGGHVDLEDKYRTQLNKTYPSATTPKQRFENFVAAFVEEKNQSDNLVRQQLQNQGISEKTFTKLSDKDTKGMADKIDAKIVTGGKTGSQYEYNFSPLKKLALSKETGFARAVKVLKGMKKAAAKLPGRAKESFSNRFKKSDKGVGGIH